ncbi:DUF2642 domain-containing protein [Paenibacillus rhizophilus]|uniref:DUF2642 domain-containing protein n=1 Tax=Paenibacillus rhizophilus TaxID=1850366 RepID=A0A3N9P6X3_9BACL|nr:DUF2642 domain-containing protein [Paenibacillus rhizophilus]RQW11983.1 DUF2642 domain-containing protein [Paenibacillus rhizophilus]
MNLLSDLLGKQVIVMVSGVLQPLEGTLRDFGPDVVIIKNGNKYLYIPAAHIRFLTHNTEAVVEPDDIPQSLPSSQETIISLRPLLENSKGIFTEIYITGVHVLHGYIQNILDDYILFYSPVFDTVLVHMKHLKYLIPYPPEVIPYSLKKDKLLSNLSAVSTESNFIQQLKKMEGNFIAMDMVNDPQKVGLLKKVQAPMFELVAPNGESIFALIDHIQTVNYPTK